MVRVRIHLLGGFLLEQSGRALPPIPSAAGRSLFAYLVTYRDRRHTRDLLAGTFWPDQPESAARRRLSQALWQIQTALQETGVEHGLVESTAIDLSFSARPQDYWLDIAAYDSHIAAAAAAGTEYAEIAELEAAVALYRGEFMAGFYDDWTDVERERLRSTYLSGLDRLTALHKSRADYETALSFARRLALHDPLREHAHREIMRLSFLLGRPNEALRQYERVATVLETELGTEPDLETDELRAQILRLRDKGEHAFAPTSRGTLVDQERPVPMVGRDEERTAVLRRMDETLLGRGGAVLIEGDSGIGKTRLVRELIEDAQWRGLSPVHVECSQEAQLQPFSALRSALASGLTRLRAQQLGQLLHHSAVADLAALVPSVAGWLGGDVASRPGGRLGRDRLRYTLRRALLALAELNPHTLFIDDAQWADEESIDVLAAIAPELHASGLMICLSYRGGEARRRERLWERLVTVDAASNTERVALVPLGLTQSTELIEQSLGVAAVPLHVAEGLFHETGGNPLFVLETLRAWHAETRDTLDAAGELGRAGDDIEFPVTGGISQVIARRLAELTPQARAIVDAMAVLGRADDAAMLTTVSGLGDLEVLEGLQRLVSAGSVVETDDGYGFSHNQVRRVALDAIEDPERRRLHRAAGEMLERDHPDRVEELARHFLGAAESAKAFQYSLAAGRRASDLGAFETAVLHYERAAGELADSDDRFSLYALWEDALDVLGRTAEQRKTLDVLDGVASSSVENAEVARRRSRLLAHEGDYGAAERLAAYATAELADTGTAVERGKAARTFGSVLRQSGRMTDALPRLEEAVAAFAGTGGDEAAARVELAGVLTELQRYDEAAGHLTAAVDGYESLGDVLGMARTYGELAIVRMEQGESVEAVELYHRALEACRECGYRRGEAVNTLNLANVLYLQGAIGHALERYDEAAAIFAVIGDRRGAALVLANSSSVRHTIVGDDVTDTVLEALDFFTAEDHRWGAAFCHEHLAAITHRAGDPSAASDHVATGLALVAGTGHRWVEMHLKRLGAEIALASGGLDEARALADEALALCEELGLGAVAPTVRSIIAMVDLEEGDAAGALAAAREATAIIEPATEQPYIVWYRLSRAAAAAGAEAESREALDRAAELLERVIDALATESRSGARAVPEHREILEARARAFVHQATVRLPGADVPTGRPLRLGDWVEITWTLTDPDDFASDSEPERRKKQLLRLLEEAAQQGGAPRVGDLAEALDVSEATVRRDLAQLRDDGHRVVTRGGR